MKNENNKNAKKESIASKLVKFLYDFNGAVVIFTILVMTALMCVEVFIRYILKGDLRGMEEYLYFFLMWMVFAGAGAAVFENTHLRSDTLIVLIKNKRFLNSMMLIVDFLEVVFYGGFLYYSYLYLMDCIAIPAKTRVWKLPRLIGQSSVIYGAIFIFIFGVYVYVTHTRGRIKALKAYRSGKLGKYDDPESLSDEEEDT